MGRWLAYSTNVSIPCDTEFRARDIIKHWASLGYTNDLCLEYVCNGRALIISRWNGTQEVPTGVTIEEGEYESEKSLRLAEQGLPSCPVIFDTGEDGICLDCSQSFYFCQCRKFN